MLYTIEELTDDRNRHLIEELLAKTQIKLVESDDDGWGERTKGGTSMISCSPTDHPIACFTHELLHVRLNLNGLARPGGSQVSADTQDDFDELSKYVNDMFSVMYNELAHHRFFASFIEMGFPPPEFLHDSDAAAHARVIRKDIPMLAGLHQKSGEDVPLRWILPPYLFCLSPHDNSDVSKHARKDLREFSGGKTDRLDTLLNEWRDAAQPDVRVYLARLCRACDLIDVGFGDDPAKLIWSSEVAV